MCVALFFVWFIYVPLLAAGKILGYLVLVAFVLFCECVCVYLLWCMLCDLLFCFAFGVLHCFVIVSKFTELAVGCYCVYCFVKFRCLLFSC